MKLQLHLSNEYFFIPAKSFCLKFLLHSFRLETAIQKFVRILRVFWLHEVLITLSRLESRPQDCVIFFLNVYLTATTCTGSLVYVVCQETKLLVLELSEGTEYIIFGRVILFLFAHSFFTSNYKQQFQYQHHGNFLINITGHSGYRGHLQ